MIASCVSGEPAGIIIIGKLNEFKTFLYILRVQALSCPPTTLNANAEANSDVSIVVPARDLLNLLNKKELQSTRDVAIEQQSKVAAPAQLRKALTRNKWVGDGRAAI